MAVVKTVGRSGPIALGKAYAGRHVLVDELEPGFGWSSWVSSFPTTSGGCTRRT